MKIDIEKLSIVHVPNKDNVIAVFDDSKEALVFSDEFEIKYKLKSSVDPLSSFLHHVSTRGQIKGGRLDEV